VDRILLKPICLFALNLGILVATYLVGNSNGLTKTNNAWADELTGTDGNDSLIGTVNPDTVNGLAGDDKLYGGSDADRLKGGEGADYFDCGKGIDEILDYNSQQGDIRGSNCEKY
jgi:Ca2+-binding RTX toxin-like protein